MHWNHKKQLHNDNWDFLVVTDGDSFQAAWGAEKRGSLNTWKWKVESDRKASYLGKKWIESEHFAGVEEKRMQAEKVWAKNAT